MNEPNNDAGSTAEAPAAKPEIFTAAQKAEWVEKYLKSGLSLRRFSGQSGLGYMSLYRWVKKQERTTESRQSHSDQAIDFAELNLPLTPSTPRSDWAVELTLRNGTVLRMSKDTPPTLVDQLLRVC
jgi:transposase-like protein